MDSQPAWDLADDVFLLPVYPARELPIDGVTSELIAGKMKKGKARVGSKDQLLEFVRDRRKVKSGLELWITAGAGDIDALVGPVKEILEGN